MNVRTIDCGDCAMSATSACDDCVVSFILRREPGEAVVIDKVDTLVLCTGHTPVDDLSDELQALGIEAHIIGDAAAPRTAEEAVYEGLKVAAEI